MNDADLDTFANSVIDLDNTFMANDGMWVHWIELIKILSEYKSHQQPKPLTENEIKKQADIEFNKIPSHWSVYEKPAFINGMKKANELIFKAK
ncbi:MAG: hypothetical protein ACP5N7_04190 [Candidatus Pacearchaeota archaeon]